MSKYSDGGQFAVTVAQAPIALAQVSRQHQDQNFHLVLLNQGANQINVIRTPLLKDPITYELSPTGGAAPGIVLDGLSWEDFANGIEAIAIGGNSTLQIMLYSNDITYRTEEVVKNEVKETLIPRDTYVYQ